MRRDGADIAHALRAVQQDVLPPLLALCDTFGDDAPLFAVMAVALDCLRETKTTRETVLDAVDVYFPPIPKAIAG
jgi:hypothetical protein